MRAQNIFMPKNITVLHLLLLTLWRVLRKQKPKKKTTKQPEEYFFQNAVTHYQHQSRVQNAIGVDFALHWLKNCRQTFQPITERSKRNRINTFDSHLKTALTQHQK